MEIEIRAKINDIKKTEKEILKLGGKLIKKKKQVDKYFGEIYLFKKLGYSFLMRVRIEKDKTFLTYKGANLKRDGVWKEYEFPISNARAAVAMLKEMGLEKIIEVHKTRTEYSFGKLTICVDNIKGLGSYIEIESLDNKNFSKKELINLIKKLNIEKNQIIDKGYVTIMLSNQKSPYSKYVVN